MIDDDVLKCPCGETYLHSYHVTHYVRHQEGSPVCPVGSGAFQDEREKLLSSPSLDRDAVGIRFWCEMCHSKYELTLAQHKGQTLIKWRLLGRMPVDEWTQQKL